MARSTDEERPSNRNKTIDERSSLVT